MGIAMRIVEASTTASRSHLYSSPEGQMDTAVLWRMAQLNYLFFSSALSDSVRLCANVRSSQNEAEQKCDSPWMLSRRTLRWRLAPPFPSPFPPLPRPDMMAM